MITVWCTAVSESNAEAGHWLHVYNHDGLRLISGSCRNAAESWK